MQTKTKTLRDAVLNIFAPYLEKNKYRYVTVGSTIIVNLDSARRLNIKLAYSHTVGHYDSVRFELKGKMSGEIDSNTVLFREVFDSYEDLSHQNRIEKYLWEATRNGIIYEWYGKPTTGDINNLVRELEKYVVIWE